MNARRSLAILVKDLRDAMRDGRILVLLALPIGMAVFYNATIEDEDELPTTKVAIVEPAGSGVARELRRGAGKSAALEITRSPDATGARRLVARGDVALAVVTSSSRRGEPARADVLVAQDAKPAAQAVVALVPDALARAAGREPAAAARISTVAATDQKPYEVIDQRALTVLIMIVLLVAFVAMMVVPMQTAEELETGTFGALRLAASGPEILAAKAVAGCIYAAAGVALTVATTQLQVDNPVLFFGAAIAFVISLVSFGLLLGLLMPNANAINTYGAFFLLPLMGLAVAALFADSGLLATILDFLPFSQATRVLGDGLAASTPYDTGPVTWLVIAAWTLLGSALLARIASRREL